jgi:hypothetical protein
MGLLQDLRLALRRMRRSPGLSQPELEDYARRSGAFESISGIWPVTANLTG